MKQPTGFIYFVFMSIGFAWGGGFVFQLLLKIRIISRLIKSTEIYHLSIIIFFMLLGGVFGLFVAKVKKLDAPQTTDTAMLSALVWLVVSTAINFSYLLFIAALSCTEIFEVEGFWGVMCDIVRSVP